MADLRLAAAVRHRAPVAAAGKIVAMEEPDASPSAAAMMVAETATVAAADLAVVLRAKAVAAPLETEAAPLGNAAALMVTETVYAVQRRGQSTSAKSGPSPWPALLPALQSSRFGPRP